MLATGLIMCLASFAYAIIIINDPLFVLPFADNLGEKVELAPHFGWSWYLNLLTGIAVIILSNVILFMNYFFPRKIAAVFHHGVVEEDEFFQVITYCKENMTFSSILALTIASGAYTCHFFICLFFLVGGRRGTS